jgi:hypothetical protein
MDEDSRTAMTLRYELNSQSGFSRVSNFRWGFKGDGLVNKVFIQSETFHEQEVFN